ncbi:MAG: ATP phosphoribosyltransferase regulatory subunit [Hyphomicrobiaceae bacterium]|nr:ATP phosphoribosyltransferase regulatory subunit [Hyphomicrobiaceae bacterium]
MVAEPTASYAALQAQANAITELFNMRGYELVAPAYLQPADLFLDRMGEAIRGRTYVFTDLDGEELCLRPDVTLPACRVYLERYPKADVEARLCYNGPAFRYQPGGGDETRPREFRQAGIEYIGGTDRPGAEAEVTALAVEAVRDAGLETFSIRIGDLGLFAALVQALDIPDRWRLRLHHFFWRPPVFRNLLRQLSTVPAGEMNDAEAALLGTLDLDDRSESEARVAAHLEKDGIPLEGTRSLSEITERLLDRAADAKQQPLSDAAVKLFESYLAVSAPARAALERIERETKEAGLGMGEALSAAHARLDRLSEAGIDLDAATFSAEFGRDLEYYTGHVFQIEIPGRGRAGHIAGGGRYDDLLQGLGAPQPTPAVGSAIHTERLLAAVRGDAA